MMDDLDTLCPSPRPQTKRLLIITGAGISADSGIKTFRDSGGLWEGHSPDVVANGMTWKKNRDLVIRFYNERRVEAGKAVPNRGHEMIAKWQHQYGAYLATQNVDGLHEAAGSPQVLHVHGNLFGMKCEACGHHWDIGATEWGLDDRCRCGSIKGTRPDVVFFNEPAPNYTPLYKAFNALREGDVFLVMGTTGQVIDVSQVAFMKPCTSILSNLQTLYAGGVLDRDFTHVIHGRAVDTVDQIDVLLAELMKDDDEPVQD